MKRFLMLTLLLAGCGGGHWVRDGASQEEAARDLAQCKHEAELAASPINDVVMRGIRVNELTQSCLQTRGYRRVS